MLQMIKHIVSQVPKNIFLLFLTVTTILLFSCNDSTGEAEDIKPPTLIPELESLIDTIFYDRIKIDDSGFITYIDRK